MEEMQRLNVRGMAVSKLASDNKNREQAVIHRVTAPATGNTTCPDFSTTAASAEVPYLKLDLRGQQIRLFELYPRAEASYIEDSFRCVDLSTCPAYTALSYTWGDRTKCREIKIHGGATIWVRENLWWFPLSAKLSSIST